MRSPILLAALVLGAVQSPSSGPARLLALGQVSSCAREESFEYYQDGQIGRGQRRVLVLDLGDGVTMEFVRVQAGTFQMGSPLGEKDRRPDEEQHSVEITRDFYLSKYEVTRGQFRAFVTDSGYRTEPERDGQGGWGYDGATGKVEGRKPNYTWQSTGFAQTDDHPVVNVTWNDADAFCRWLALRSKQAIQLPTGAEWEYAARAGSVARFYSGNDEETLAKVGNVADRTAKKQFQDWQTTIAGDDGYLFTAPVGRFPRIGSGSTTCSAMSGSGVKIGWGRTGTLAPRTPSETLKTNKFVLCVADLGGSASRRFPAPPSASRARHRAGTWTWGSVFPVQTELGGVSP